MLRRNSLIIPDQDRMELTDTGQAAVMCELWYLGSLCCKAALAISRAAGLHLTTLLNALGRNEGAISVLFLSVHQSKQGRRFARWLAKESFLM